MLEKSAAAAMLHMISAFGASQALYVAAKLALPDLLDDAPQTIEQVAARTETHADSLARLMRALTSMGLFTIDDQRRYTLTPVGATLRTDASGSLRSWVLVALGEESRQAWGELARTVRTGEIAFDHVFAMNVWEYRARHPEHARVFNDAMGHMTALYNTSVIEAYSFAKFAKVIDVGGGNGSLLIALLEANPGMRGAIFDIPHVAEAAKRRVDEANLSDRCEVVSGDAFSDVPRGGNAYILSRVIHDWNDDRALAILTSCRRAIAPDATLLLIERVLPDSFSQTDDALPLCITDLHMMVMNGGRERSEAQYRTLLARAGFTLTRIVATGSCMNVIEARPLTGAMNETNRV